MIAISGPRGPLFAARDLGTCIFSPESISAAAGGRWRVHGRTKKGSKLLYG